MIPPPVLEQHGRRDAGATATLEDPLLTRKEVRYRLRGMSRTTLWRREREGKLKFNRQGEIRLSAVVEFEEWLRGCDGELN